VDEAVAAGADVILLDNLSIEEVREAIRRIGGRSQVELSGGVTLERIPELSHTGANYVSVGALTHSAPAVDLSFELEPDDVTADVSSHSRDAHADLSAEAPGKARGAKADA
jgi:nicotinate-nucleotide pyrophosphorylase (carboxylating)